MNMWEAGPSPACTEISQAQKHAQMPEHAARMDSLR